LAAFIIMVTSLTQNLRVIPFLIQGSSASTDINLDARKLVCLRYGGNDPVYVLENDLPFDLRDSDHRRNAGLPAHGEHLCDVTVVKVSMFTIHNEKIEATDLEDFGDFGIFEDGDHRSQNGLSCLQSFFKILDDSPFDLFPIGAMGREKTAPPAALLRRGGFQPSGVTRPEIVRCFGNASRRG